MRHLQALLSAAGVYPWRVDGIYGPQTRRAVLAFQYAHGLLPDGIAGPQTLGALDMVGHPDSAPAPASIGDTLDPTSTQTPALHRCDPRVWAAWLRLRDTLTGADSGQPVRYGPGRGLWVPGRGWIVTHGPGALGHTRWRSRLGETYPSLHCSSWTNLFLGWLTGRGSLYTHPGNIPPLDRLCTVTGSSLHAQALGDNGRPVAAPFRGYGEDCMRLSGKGRYATMTWRELHKRRGELGTFNVFAQSTRNSAGRWKWWHHTGVLVCDHSHPDKPLSRIAADGFRGGAGYSATPMDVEHVDAQWADKYEGRIMLYVFRVRPNARGLFGAGAVPTPVTLETIGHAAHDRSTL